MDKTNPDYYKNRSIESFDCIQALIEDKDPKEAYIVGQIIKYVSRYNQKNGIEDLEKADWYLDRLKSTISDERKPFVHQIGGGLDYPANQYNMVKVINGVKFIDFYDSTGKYCESLKLNDDVISDVWYDKKKKGWEI